MLFNQQILEQIAQGDVSLAFRRWQRSTVRAGGQLRTAVGVLAIDAIDVVTLDQVTDADAQQAGYHSPWARMVLRLIQAHPETRAAELATLAQLETAALKINVRKLKELGLTESIAKGGYRLSPRGQAVLKRLDCEKPAL